ncbi:hypothetical protein CDAR_257771 [Caerostris darwini]|uniref:Uncharacterized protein n=1 Tax=Caerostris darwini TaxID=1538125 RepID=A0AAV4WV07_9ARAC|nr:hypothetical protein CDAR_257771 [Caerostris darwini]
MNVQRSLTALKIAPSRQKIETREEKNIDRLSGYINDSLNHPVEHQEQKSGFFFDALFFLLSSMDSRRLTDSLVCGCMLVFCSAFEYTLTTDSHVHCSLKLAHRRLFKILG